MLTQEDIEAIRKRAEAATRGPWIKYNKHGKWISNYPYWDYVGEINKDADYEFIVKAREDVPKLLAEIERLRAESDYWRMEHEHQRKQAEVYLEKYRLEKDKSADMVREMFGGKIEDAAKKIADELRRKLGDTNGKA
ncbi:hypothetical protein [Neobacillus mesonae]|uniref:Uncharacterized protein n=1 Tax=Neobacillus mesonae TaxID=1193713 RepID=A0A3T0HV29_9BACI|nr:hypothetical protein [Neobacillus mesonae]AZU61014.1 hypothetical protein CHR53_06980 [Neobacillus mesonae]